VLIRQNQSKKINGPLLIDSLTYNRIVLTAKNGEMTHLTTIAVSVDSTFTLMFLKIRENWPRLGEADALLAGLVEA
jgi:hypothetical protein